ncbi:hypothetical protein K502DRAFT_337476 [Neoconidiobolus thromboides FSU 785]|nr:hypothetical protein K502DRAFT_337476 [Neoconidiobolus thromboides FSU 785]
MIQFGRYFGLCENAPLPLCPLVEKPHLNGPLCYARSIEINSTLIFQPATLAMQIVALLMTIVMIYHIKTKYTAVGRKEMVLFFYLYLLTIVMEFIVVSGLVATASPAYPFLVAGYYGLISACLFSLMLNGFVGFQFAEDGTFWSLWTIRVLSFVVFGLSYFVAVGTFLNIGFSSTSPTVLWIWMYIFQGLSILIYSVLQIILVVNTLDDLWPIGNVILGLLLFISGQIILHILSPRICDYMGHYIDGFFFEVICTLLSVMMVYKYWDSITKEDLEFSVSGNQNVWEVKELLEDMEDTYDPSDFKPIQSNFNQNLFNSNNYHT